MCKERGKKTEKYKSTRSQVAQQKSNSKFEPGVQERKIGHALWVKGWHYYPTCQSEWQQPIMSIFEIMCMEQGR